MKKIILSWFIILGMITFLNQSLASTATVQVTAVRIRESASTDSNIITNLYEDDEVEILEENGEWYKVQYNGKVGYAKAEFFKKKNETTENTVTQNTTADEPVQNNESIVDEQNVQPENTTETSQELKIGTTVSVARDVKLRIIPNLSASDKIEIKKGDNVTVEAELGKWYKIKNETVEGWLMKTKLTAGLTPTEEPAEQPQEPETPQAPENTTPPETVTPEQPTTTTTPTETTMNKTAVVIVETARVREGASTKANIIDVLDEDDIVTIIGEEGDFYKITTNKISSGFISKTLVKEKDVTSRSTAEERTVESKSPTKQDDIIEFAKQFLGYPYVLGCSSPETGFDCSGFTRYVFGHFGYKLGRVAADQTSLGAVVERADLEVGDLLLFYDDAKTKIGHCGIYMGNGQFIHSANPKRGVVTDNLNTNSYYSQRFVTARRIAGG